MRLTPWEEDRLLVFAAAELARRHRAAGLPLNAPEAIALICDAMFEAARAGGTYAEVEAAGRAAVGSAEVMPGVRELVDDVRLEVMLGDGTRLVVLLDPLGPTTNPLGPTREQVGGEGLVEAPATAGVGPGAVRQAPVPSPVAEAPAALGGGALPERPDRTDLTVRSESRRVIRVTSHYPFERVNPRLVFDREAARGYRLDLPAGSSERWAPGEVRTVRLVRFRGSAARGSAGGRSGRPADGPAGRP